MKEHELITIAREHLVARGFHVETVVATPSPDLQVVGSDGTITHLNFSKAEAP